MAEAEVISWLADRDRFGVPPAELELVDERTMYWPSYEEPQNCFLFRFTYRFAQGDLTNIMIAGPLVYAFQADMRPLEADDIYAVFAGWQAEHEDIYEVPAARFQFGSAGRNQTTVGRPDHEGIEELKPLALTFFFGERAVLAMGFAMANQYARSAMAWRLSPCHLIRAQPACHLTLFWPCIVGVNCCGISTLNSDKKFEDKDIF